MQTVNGGKSWIPSSKYDNFLGLFDLPDNKKLTLKRQKAVNQREPVDPEFREAMAVLCCKTWDEKGRRSVFYYTIIKITFLCKLYPIPYPRLLFWKKVPSPLQSTPTSEVFNLRP